MRLFDTSVIGQSERFKGVYSDRKAWHRPDLDVIIRRARSFGVRAIIFSTGYIADVEVSLANCYRFKNTYTTIGVSAPRSMDPYQNFDLKLGRSKTKFEHKKELKLLKENVILMDSLLDRKFALETYFKRMDKILENDYYSKRKIVAVGVCGLDFSRKFIPKQLQI